MKFHHYLLVPALILLLTQALASGTPAQPNVLFIAVDDLNDWVGCLAGNTLK